MKKFLALVFVLALVFTPALLMAQRYSDEGEESGTSAWIFVLGGVGAILLVVFICALFSAFYTVEQQTAAIVERFRKYKKTTGPGLHTKMPFIDRVADRVTLRVRQLDLPVETKTKDDVFTVIKLAVQYYVPSIEKVFDAHYKLVNHEVQMNSWVFDLVRAEVPTMKLDEVFENKDKIADNVKDHLQDRIREYGFEIVRALVNDIEPDAKVKAAMNEINTQARLRTAAEYEGEGKKILVVKAAEAEAASKELQGIGIAKQRIAIAKGLKEAVEACTQAGVEVDEATMMVLLTQYFDTLQAIGSHDKANTIFLPHSPSNLKELWQQIGEGVMIGRQVPEGGAKADDARKISKETKEGERTKKSNEDEE